MWWPFGKKPVKIRNVDYTPPPPPTDLMTKQLIDIEDKLPPPQDWLDRTERTLRRIDRIRQELDRLKRDKPDSPRIESFRKELAQLTQFAKENRVEVHIKV